MVGKTGRVICIDLQPQMINGLKKKAAKAGLSNQIETRICLPDSLQIPDLNGQIDFVFAFAVMHELPKPKQALIDIKNSLKKEGYLLISEPSYRVTKDAFDLTVKLAQECDFKVKEYPKIKGSISVLLE